MSKELFKTIEAQGRLITELRGELEQIKLLATKVVTHYYESEQTHYEELKATYDENEWEKGEALETPNDHIFLTLLKLEGNL
tara:strand:+ start:634 stop:879 length:246 start_codon:yes stop_codon:yes gene_type:complete